jgi:glutathione peroxidase
MSIYDFKVKTLMGKDCDLSQFKGKVLLIVNTASKCGFTPQYEGLEKLYKKYHDQGFDILGFPSNQFAEQEPGTASDIAGFCKLNYGVTFPMFQKGDVRGANAQPLYKYLTSEKKFEGFNMNHPNAKGLVDFIKKNLPKDYLDDDSIKWNFTKFLVDREGHVVARFEPTTVPEDIESQIEKLL